MPCETPFYESEKEEFAKTTAVSKLVTQFYREALNIKVINGTETQTVWIGFDTSNVVTSEEIKLTSFPSFISAVGGNLGLFVGFSCLPLLLWLAEVRKKFECFTSFLHHVE